MKAKLSSFAALTICLLFLASGAFASSTNYSWTFASMTGNISGSGELTAVPEGGGQWFITGGTGTVTYNSTIYDITFVTNAYGSTPGFTVNSNGDQAIFDNLLWPMNSAGSQLDNDGVALALKTPVTLSGGVVWYGLGVWDSPSQVFCGFGVACGYNSTSTPFTVALVPEPFSTTTILLLGSGLVGLAGMGRRRLSL